MALKDKKWKPVTLHHVVAEFLLGERDKFHLSSLGVVIATPNVDDPQENFQRLRALYLVRAPFFAEIPPDTRWYEVRKLTDQELNEIHVVRFSSRWIGDATGKNELYRVAKRSPETLKAPPANWRRPILSGVTKSRDRSRSSRETTASSPMHPPDEHHIREVVIDFEIVVIEGRVLLGVEHLQKRRGWRSS